MLRLATVLFSLIATTLAGSFVVVALTIGMVTLEPILAAAAIGALLAVPASLIVAKRIVTA